MALQVIGQTIRNVVLGLLEYGLKLSAFLGVLVALGSGQSFLGKVMAGSVSVASLFQKLPEAYNQAVAQAKVIHDYNAMETAAFTDLHGPKAVNEVMQTLNGITSFFYGIEQNVAAAPVSTVGAALLVFSTFFVAGWMLRIMRQGVDDLFRVRMEKKVWRFLLADDSEARQSQGEAQPFRPAKDRKSAEKEEETIPELEVEERWNDDFEQEVAEKQEDEGENGEEEEFTTAHHEIAGLGLNLNADSDITEFEENDSEKLSSSNKEQDIAAIPVASKEEEETSEEEEFDLESELKSVMEGKPQDLDSKDGGLVHNDKPTEQDSLPKRRSQKGSTTSKKSSLSENIDIAKKSRKHSLEEFLKMARASD